MASTSKLKLAIGIVIAPYLLGCFLSKYILPPGLFEEMVQPLMENFSSRKLEKARTMIPIPAENSSVARSVTEIPSRCKQNFKFLLGLSANEEDEFLQSIPIEIHRNGEPDACGEIESDKSRFFIELQNNYVSFTQNECPKILDKYQVEALITQTLHQVINACPSVEEDGNKQDGFLGFCDMGPKKTPILLDHNDLVSVVSPESGKSSLPCRFHTREGLRITKLRELVKIAKESPSLCEGQSEDDSQTCTAGAYGLSLYAVPAGRVFMFAPKFVGEIFKLPHVQGSGGNSIHLEVISLSPRVFDVFNFFSREESKELVDKAIAETKDSHRIKRSTTGASEKSVNSRRTSESGFDTHGKTATKVKRRCFKALGFDEYWESHGDGLQILRYNLTTAYNSHLDWIEDKTGRLEHDYESGGTGGNRFATILMYMSDLDEEDGGETVFPKGWPPNVAVEDRVDSKAALEDLRASERGGVLKQGSWEEEMVSKCRSRLAIRPHSSRAVLFYSQLPNGQVDPASLHGACPILSGQKYAANLWVWNTPRTGYPGSPIKEKFKKKSNGQGATSSPSVAYKKITATFKNTGKNEDMKDAKLYFGTDRFWHNMGHSDPGIKVHTYDGHLWTLKVDGKEVQRWAIKEKDGSEQEFSF